MEELSAIWRHYWTRHSTNVVTSCSRIGVCAGQRWFFKYLCSHFCNLSFHQIVFYACRAGRVKITQITGLPVSIGGQIGDVCLQGIAWLSVCSNNRQYLIQVSLKDGILLQCWSLQIEVCKLLCDVEAFQFNCSVIMWVINNNNNGNF